jgi:O-antigen ligase
MTYDRARLAALADYLAAATVISLPWSTSATSILLPLWAVAVVLTLDVEAIRRVGPIPAAAFPVALVILAVAGMLWSEAAWPQRLVGLSHVLNLLAVPLLFVQFSRSERSEMVLGAFLASAVALLAVSWLLVLFPQIPWRTVVPGVPVKDYIVQSGEFALCAFVLLDRAITAWDRWRARSVLLAGLGLLFIANIVFVALGRTSVVIVVALFGLLGLRHFQRRALAAFVAAGVALSAVAWTTSPYLRFRMMHLVEELDGSYADPNETSAGARVGFWKLSVKVIPGAPLFGHGTGSTPVMLARAAADDPAAPTNATNPHNQILATAIPFGLLGVVLLLAMWAAHLRLFLLPGPTAFVGLSVVVQNFIGSLFNSHLFDFSQGLLYVFGVGIAGGVMLRKHAGKFRAAETLAPAVSPKASGLKPAAEPAA